MKAFIALHLWAADHKVNRYRQQGGPFLQPTQSWSRVHTAYTATWKYIISNTSNYYSDFMLFPKTTSWNAFTFIFEPPITLPPIVPQELNLHSLPGLLCWQILDERLSADMHNEFFHCFRHRRIIAYEDVLAGAFPNKLTLCFVYKNAHLLLQIPNMLLTLVKISSPAKCYNSSVCDLGPSLRWHATASTKCFCTASAFLCIENKSHLF